MRIVFDSVTDLSLWMASQGFLVAFLITLIPYALITLPIQYGIRRLLAKHECETNDFAFTMVSGILNGVTGITVAFVVVTLWNHHREQDGILKKEAQVIENLHTDFKQDPKMMRKSEQALVLYVQTVATMEFNEETRQAGSEDAVKYLDEIYQLAQQIKDPLTRSHAINELGNLSSLRHQRLSGTFQSPIHPALWLTVVLLTFLTLLNLIMFNSKKSGYTSVSIASVAYALILTLANQLEYPYLGPLSVSIDPMYLLLQKYENP
jgi:cytochrome bd-type quinol oxidase subunit 2